MNNAHQILMIKVKPMKKTWMFGLFGSLALSLSMPTLAQTPLPTKTPPSYSEALELLKTGSLSLDKNSLLSALQVFRDCPSPHKDSFSCPYRAAQACLYLTRALDFEKHRDQAEKILTEGIQSAQAAVSLAPQSADTHALLARLYQVKLMYGDMFTGMDIGPKAGAENKKALSIDPQNPQVQLSLGVQYVMAPPIGGGDVKKGITTLEKALELDPKMDEAYYWLAKAYRKQNDRPHFKEALQSAMKFNPRNPLYPTELESWKP